MRSFITACALLALLLAGCSGEDGLTGTGPSTPVSASPTPIAEDPRDILITWTPAEAPLFTAEEQIFPSADFYPNVPRERLVWRLYQASVAGGEPVLMYEGQRWLFDSVWAPDGRSLRVRYSAAAAVPPNGPNIVAGILTFNPDDSGSTPGEAAVQAGGLSAVSFAPSPDGRTIMLARATAIPTPADLAAAGPGQGFHPPMEVTRVDVLSKSSFRLGGFQGTAWPLSEGGWSPDSRFFLAFASQTGIVTSPTSGDFYSVPVSSGRARYVASGTSLRTAWSSTQPSRLAYVDDAGALWLFDAGTGGNKRLSADGTFDQGTEPRWWRDGRNVQITNRVVDVTTGETATYPTNQPGAFYPISPDGRYMLTADDPTSDDAGRCPSISPPDNHVYLYDRTANQSRLLKDCDGRFLYFFDWLADSRHAVMRQSPCAACDGFAVGLLLKDVLQGGEVQLTSGLEFGAWPILSPDGLMVLVTGDKLRIYTEDGALRRAIDVPEGFSVTSAAWSPDGKRFAYVVGPKGVGGN